MLPERTGLRACLVTKPEEKEPSAASTVSSEESSGQLGIDDGAACRGRRKYSVPVLWSQLGAWAWCH